MGVTFHEVLKLTLRSFEVRFLKEVGQLSVTIQDGTQGNFLPYWFKVVEPYSFQSFYIL